MTRRRWPEIPSIAVRCPVCGMETHAPLPLLENQAAALKAACRFFCLASPAGRTAAERRAMHERRRLHGITPSDVQRYADRKAADRARWKALAEPRHG